MRIFAGMKAFPLLLAGLLAACGGDDSSSTSTPPPMSGFSVSGTITVPGYNAVDSDVNDLNAPYQSNDSAATAQLIPNPVILGGYVNRPGAGAEGRSQASGDTIDSYQVNLLEGQIINLLVGNDNVLVNDVDLYLLSTDGEVLAFSRNRGENESLIMQVAGTYIIQARVLSGASNYVLSIGQNTSGTQAASGMSSQAEFVPGDVTVTLKPEIKQTQAALLSMSASLGIKQAAGEPSRRMLFQQDDQRPRALALDMVFATPELRAKHETLDIVKALQQRPEVATAEPNYLFHASAVPNDEYYRYQWHYPFINLPQAWDTTTGDASVVVAVVDTGVLTSHPDLQGKLVQGYDFVSDTKISLDGNGIDSNPNDPGDQSMPGGGGSFHGSHVAGTIGASSNNTTGVTGVAWKTSIMPMRVLGKGGSGTDYDIEQAIRYAAGLSNDSNTTPSRRANVINMSLGGPTISSTFQSLVNTVRNQGIFFAAAAGNDGLNSNDYPAALEGVISVSAVNINRQRAAYSNYSTTVDVAAPGGDISTDVNGDGVNDGVVSTLADDSSGSVRYIFAPLMGTSMATPHIAGVIALMKAVNSNLTPADFDRLLSSGQITEDLGSSGKDSQFGYGLINAYKAVTAAAELNGGTPPQATAMLVASPTDLNFGLTQTAQTISVGNSGGGSLRVTQVRRDSNFLSISPTAVDDNGLGSYTVSVNRSQLSPGTYTGTVTFVSDVNSAAVKVIMQVGSSTATGDAGYQYILLVDPVSLETIEEAKAPVVNGRYSFSFFGVQPGSYIVVSGSDINRDFDICDAGESCGAYLTLSNPSQITVDRNLSGLNFTTGFSTQFQSQAMGAAPTPKRGFRRLPEQEAERGLAR